MLAKEHPNALAHDYEVNGKILKRHQVIDIILDCLKEENKTIFDIQKEINMDVEQLRNMIRYMRNANFISNTGKKKGDYFLYETCRECLIAEVLGYTKENILKNLKIKNIQKESIEDFPNKASHTKNNDIFYGNHYLNSIYYHDGD